MKILLTGGQGFLGGAVAKNLLERGHGVRAYCRRPAPELEALGAEIARGDLSDAPALGNAAEGCEGVIHCAAKSGVWGKLADFIEANFFGTLNALSAARGAGCAWFVQTSSPSVVHTGAPLAGADESAPYGENPSFGYPFTKMLAEKAVLAANAPNFRTLALRPHLIWGPGDPHFMPRFIERAEKRRLFLFKSEAKVDATYIVNAAWAHVLAAEKLSAGEHPGGRAYFVGQGEPVRVAELVSKLLTAGGGGRGLTVRAELPPLAGAIMAPLAEFVWRFLRLKGEPPLTRFVFEELTRPHWFDLTAIRRDLGYSPLVTMEDGLARFS